MLLLADISMDIAFGIFFYILNNIQISFNDQKLKWRFYIIKEALLIIKLVKLVEKKEFAVLALDLEDETFIVYIVFITSLNSIYLSQRV